MDPLLVKFFCGHPVIHGIGVPRKWKKNQTKFNFLAFRFLPRTPIPCSLSNWRWYHKTTSGGHLTKTIFVHALYSLSTQDAFDSVKCWEDLTSEQIQNLSRYLPIPEIVSDQEWKSILERLMP